MSVRPGVSGRPAPLWDSWDHHGPATGPTRFSAWVAENADGLGRTWANELARHFR